MAGPELSSPTQRERLRSVVLLLGLGLSIQACSSGGKLDVSYEPWQVIGPGTPPADNPNQPLMGRTLREGTGATVALGDAVEMHFRTTATGRGGRKAGEYDEGLGWIWIGFNDGTNKDFPRGTSLAATLIGLRQGSVHTFLDNPRAQMQGYYANVHGLLFGSATRFYDAKPMAQPGNGGAAYSERGPGHDVTRIEITRICKGQAAQRLVTLLDSSTISVAQDMFRTHDTNEPRWMYVREAKWEGHCSDGAQASFQYGPIVVDPPPGKTKGLDVSTLWGPWMQNAWKNVPNGVVVK